MELADVSKKVTKPVTKSEWVELLKKLEINHADVLVVYANLEAFDYVIGGAQAVIEAIYEVVGYHTTIIMPAHNVSSRYPSLYDETLAPKWKPLVYKHLPAYDVELSPVLAGEVSQTFARMQNVCRSGHPIASFLASGRKSEWFMKDHQLESMFGEKSPLQKMYAQDAKILCLGVDYDRLSALHLASYYATTEATTTYEAVIMKDGKREVVAFEDLALDSNWFKDLGTIYEKTVNVPKQSIGEGVCKLINYRSLIDFATDYLKAK